MSIHVNGGEAPMVIVCSIPFQRVVTCTFYLIRIKPGASGDRPGVAKTSPGSISRAHKISQNRKSATQLQAIHLCFDYHVAQQLYPRSLHSNHLVFPDVPLASNIPPYPDRLATYHGYWDANIATARQLAAIGHVYDRPPLEAIEEGSRCVTCSSFVRKEMSVRAFEGNPSTKSYSRGFQGFQLHYPGCDWLSVRIPLEPQSVLGMYGGRINDMKNRFEKPKSVEVAHASPRADYAAAVQTNPLFSLPTEVRLQIYAYVLPSLAQTTRIQPLNSDSARIVTEEGAAKVGPRDLTKTNILCTCRLVHNEALDILFSGVTYQFPSSKVLYLFLRHIGSHGRSLLKSIDVHCGHREDAIAFSLLGTCMKLHSITIRLFRSTLLLPGRVPLWIEEGVACLLDMSGMKEVRFGDCGSDKNYFLNEENSDAAILRRELTRERGTPGGLTWIDGRLNL
nr:hypothetical protein CFP56_20907 [Quercus suber]